MWINGRAGEYAMADPDCAGTAYAMPSLGYEVVSSLIGMVTSSPTTLTWPLFVGATSARLGAQRAPAVQLSNQ